jgi:uncharacterized protein (DUF1684 family)
MAYEDDVLQWRQEVEARLRGEESWLSLAGLFWLTAGENSLGSGRHSSILLPEGTAPEVAGRIDFDGRRAVFHAVPGVEARSGEELVGSLPLRPDISDSPTRVRLGDVTLVIVVRAGRWGVRVWNRRHPARAAFPGRRWFPIQEAWVRPGRFVRYDPPRTMKTDNVLGDSETALCPGHVDFDLGGTSARLLVTDADADGLFLIFADPSNGNMTYPSGRFLATGSVAGEQVQLDFNRAYNPPCAFSPFATCPLPQAENHLPVPIEAGEMYVVEGGQG